MDSFPADTLLSSSHSSSRSGTWLPPLRPALGRAAPSCSWHTLNDAFDPPFIAHYVEPDHPHIKFARPHALRGGFTPFNTSYVDANNACLSPPSSSSASKSTIPLPEDAGEFVPLYSTHVVGVLDSPPIMRREDLVSQKPLTPPPTNPHPTLNLPDPDVDMPVCDEEEEDESYPYPSTSSSPHAVQSVIPLPPLSPSWGPPCTQPLQIPSPQDFQEPEDLNGLFSPYNASTPLALDYFHPAHLSPHQPSSLLEVDAPCPLLTAGQPFESDPLSAPKPSSRLLNDYDERPPPSSPLIPRRDLPDLEDGFPTIVPSSPSRRLCSRLPDSDTEMGDSALDSMSSLPGQHLLSLPGVDTDDELIPRVAVPSCSIPPAESEPLLFIDGPGDVSLPRSPSPEDFDLCLSPEDMTDPELAKLFDLRRRSIAAERATWRLETLTVDTDLLTRAEYRKKRKREHERSKEVSALLRLKLGDGMPMCSHEQQSPECDTHHQTHRRGVIGSMSQLVAQMVFRRSETSRPLARRVTANTSSTPRRSTLVNAVTADE